MWLSRPLRAVRRTYTELEYIRHMPKEYIEKAKRTVPRKVWDNRFGAPPITRWFLPPDDYVPTSSRPWEQAEFGKTTRRVQLFFSKRIRNKFFEKRRNLVERIPDEQWTVFVGDLAQVMVGKDKGKQGVVVKVVRDNNSVFVEGLHTRLEKDFENAQKLGIPESMSWKEQALDLCKKQVMLVDPNNNEPCDARWVLNDSKTEYIRLSVQSGYEIPIPGQASVTYEYVKPEKYIEVKEKDTPMSVVLERTYTPKVSTFEDEIMEEMGIHDERVMKPTYWY